MGIALAAGQPGAFAIGRQEIADSLAGVAIAISLVPPLCVVGITLHHGGFGEAGGAFLLSRHQFYRNPGNWNRHVRPDGTTESGKDGDEGEDAKKSDGGINYCRYFAG